MSEELWMSRNPTGYDPNRRFRNRLERAQRDAYYLYGPRFDPEFRYNFHGSVPLRLCDGTVLFINPEWTEVNRNVTEIFWDTTVEIATYILWVGLHIQFQSPIMLTHEEFELMYRTARRVNLIIFAEALIFQLVQRNRLQLAIDYGLERAWTAIFFREHLGHCFPETVLLGLPCPELDDPRLPPRQSLPSPSSPPAFPDL